MHRHITSYYLESCPDIADIRRIITRWQNTQDLEANSIRKKYNITHREHTTSTAYVPVPPAAHIPTVRSGRLSPSRLRAFDPAFQGQGQTVSGRGVLHRIVGGGTLERHEPVTANRLAFASPAPYLHGVSLQAAASPAAHARPRPGQRLHPTSDRQPVPPRFRSSYGDKEHRRNGVLPVSRRPAIGSRTLPLACGRTHPLPP